MIEDRLIELAQKARPDKPWWGELGDRLTEFHPEDAAFMTGASPEVILALANVVKAAREAEKVRQRAVAVFRSHGIVFEDIGTDPKNWQHVAFSVYTDLCEVSDTTRDALSALDALKEEKR